VDGRRHSRLFQKVLTFLEPLKITAFRRQSNTNQGARLPHGLSIRKRVLFVERLTWRHIAVSTPPSLLQIGRLILAGASLLRSRQAQVGEPKIAEHAQ
jgi:hypothetical protein